MFTPGLHHEKADPPARRLPIPVLVSVAVVVLAAAVVASARHSDTIAVTEEGTQASARPGSPAMNETAGFDHQDWTEVLQRFVDERGMVDYRGLSRDRAVFDRYVARIQSQGPETRPNLFPTRDHALAYYVNAYNAMVFWGVISRGPEETSVWRGLISGLNFFGRMRIEVDGRRTNLKKLEDDLIRDGFRDPRIHAALNCASIGCPRLFRTAYEPATLNEQLDAAMTEWVADPAHCAVDAAARTVTLNKIFDWFSGDFLELERSQGNPSPNLIDYVNRFRAEGEQIPRDYAIRFGPYDKGINKQ